MAEPIFTRIGPVDKVYITSYAAGASPIRIRKNGVCVFRILDNSNGIESLGDSVATDTENIGDAPETYIQTND